MYYIQIHVYTHYLKMYVQYYLYIYIYTYIPWKSNFVGLQTAILYLVRVHHAPKGTSMFTMVVDIQDVCM